VGESFLGLSPRKRRHIRLLTVFLRRSYALLSDLEKIFAEIFSSQV
jgi:hypothetical protein